MEYMVFGRQSWLYRFIVELATSIEVATSLNLPMFLDT
jgi:hypothetical protein